jgi:hypothetical protein
MRGSALLAVLITLPLSACAAAAPSRTPTPAPTAQPLVSGELVGGIQRCYGIPPPSSQTPQFVAGSVDVYKEDVPGGGPLMAHADLPDNGMFSFTLPPGHYAVIGRWGASNLRAMLVDTEVRPGAVTRVDVQFSGCI